MQFESCSCRASLSALSAFLSAQATPRAPWPRGQKLNSSHRFRGLPGYRRRRESETPGQPRLPVAGPANTTLADSVARETARVPEPVTGDPETDRKLGTVIATEVTVPTPALAMTKAVVAICVVFVPFPAVGLRRGNARQSRGRQRRLAARSVVRFVTWLSAMFGMSAATKAAEGRAAALAGRRAGEDDVCGFVRQGDGKRP